MARLRLALLEAVKIIGSTLLLDEIKLPTRFLVVLLSRVKIAVVLKRLSCGV